MLDNLHIDHTLTTLAERVHMSARNLSRTFIPADYRARFRSSNAAPMSGAGGGRNASSGGRTSL